MKLKYAFLTSIVLTLVLYLSLNATEDTGTLIKLNLEPLTIQSRLLNLPHFEYLINNTCKNSEIVLIITSYSGNVEARSALRQAYSKRELQRLGIERIFLLAALKKNTDVSQKSLYDENRRFEDLLQGNFYESYRNLTYKHVMGLKWAGNCKSRYIIKMDDDIVVNLYELKKTIYKDFKKDMMGYVFDNMRPIRIKKNKWYVTKDEYRGNIYPRFLSGWLYVTTPKAARKIAETAQSMEYFWIDDLFLTGIVPERLGYSYDNIGFKFTTHPEIIECCISNNIMCSYLVGPSGGDYSLHKRFQQHVYKCLHNKCQIPIQKIDDTCVAKRKLPSLGKGLPSLSVIKL